MNDGINDGWTHLSPSESIHSLHLPSTSSPHPFPFQTNNTSHELESFKFHHSRNLRFLHQHRSIQVKHHNIRVLRLLLLVLLALQPFDPGRNLKSEKPRVGVFFVIFLTSISLKSSEARITVFDPRRSSRFSSYGFLLTRRGRITHCLR